MGARKSKHHVSAAAASHFTVAGRARAKRRGVTGADVAEVFRKMDAWAARLARYKFPSYHEAGHAMVGRTLGCVGLDIELKPTDSNNGGSCYLENGEFFALPVDGLLLFCAGGWAGETEYYRRTHRDGLPAYFHASRDKARALKAWKKARRPADKFEVAWKSALQGATKLVRQHWDEVTKLATLARQADKVYFQPPISGYPAFERAEWRGAGLNPETNVPAYESETERDRTAFGEEGAA